MRKIVLLDLDGTITEARRPLTGDLLLDFREVFGSEGFEFGVVTGSPLGFMLEQIGPLWGEGLVNYWMPCNGTWAYKDGAESPSHKVDMRTSLGEEAYRKLIRKILEAQAQISETPGVPLSGSFVTFRESMVNWSPIGRDSSIKDREDFISLDGKTGLRKNMLLKLPALFPEIFEKVTMTLGGQTSFDLYPKGWDKTYCLRHFPGEVEIFFIGDATHPGGNDHSIAAHPSVQSWTTEGPRDTLRILRSLLGESR